MSKIPPILTILCLIQVAPVWSQAEESTSTALDAAESTEYLVTLSLSDPAQPELHLIPVTPLKASPPAELPAWLPYLGDSSPAQS